MSDNGTRTAKLGELKTDAHNANAGTERGRYMLDHSLRQYGAGRSILVDREGRVIAGNKTLEAAADIGLEDVVIVQTDGTKLVAVQRTDLDLEDGDEARLLAYADNRASETGLAWDAEVIQFDLEAGLDLSGMFQEWEVNRILDIVDEVDYDELWQGMPEFEQENAIYRTIKVHFATEEDVKQFSTLIGQSITDKTISIWHPKAGRMDLSGVTCVDES